MDLRSVKSAASEVVGNRRWLRRQLRDVAPDHSGSRVLEIGSGKPVDGNYPYSMRDLFDTAGEFVMSDIDPSFGHGVVDLTDVDEQHDFDLVLCISVLEHIPDVAAAVDGLRRVLRPGGSAFVAVPFAYPLHDEPADFWRLSEHALRMLFSEFTNVSISHRGWRRLPTGLALRAETPSA